MTIAAALTRAISAISEAGVDTPRLDAQILLAWVLKSRREGIAREPERVLTDREQIIFAKAISLRTERRPVPYITGEQWFYGRPFKINRAVLIPRPETELLVTAALERCQGIVSPALADIGTGSGCLAVTLACELPEAQVWATDLSADALTLARKNVVRQGVEDRVMLRQGNLLAALPNDLRLDIIVSNPPYITDTEVPGLQPEVRDYEPQLALSGENGATGVDGTALHGRLLDDSPVFLKPGGWVLLEVGFGQAERVAEYAQAQGYDSVAMLNDFAGIGRVVAARWK